MLEPMTQNNKPDKCDVFSQEIIAKAPNAKSLTLEEIIKNKTMQKNSILEKINYNSRHSVLIGGFIKPEKIKINDTDNLRNSRKISELVRELQGQEQEINTLSNSLNRLKVAQATEYARQESEARQAAEKRMQQAIEQANLAFEQLRAALVKAREIEEAQAEEIKLRQLAQEQCQQAIARANNIEISLKTEQQAKLVVEKKLQLTITKLNKSEANLQSIQQDKNQLEIKIQNILEQLNNAESSLQTEISTHTRAKNQLIELEKLFANLDNANKETCLKLEQLKINYKTISKEKLILESKMLSVIEQNSKYKSIIESEQELRKESERRAQEAKIRAARAELAIHTEQKQNKLIREKAQQAINNASRTIMRFLNLNSSFNNNNE